jgi:hypothetical protein
MDDALESIVDDFREAVGRAPTAAEIRQGLEFSLAGREDVRADDGDNGDAGPRRPASSTKRQTHTGPRFTAHHGKAPPNKGKEKTTPQGGARGRRKKQNGSAGSSRLQRAFRRQLRR